MLNEKTVSPEEVGARIAFLREAAGIRQGELATRIGLSPAVVSRIESGERMPTDEDLVKIIEAIGSAEALSLQKSLERDWFYLGRAPLGHPDEDLLWDAQQMYGKLTDLLNESALRSPLRNRIQAYLDDLTRFSDAVCKREYQVVLIGSIGIGKSTALCKLAGLEIAREDGNFPSPVLEAGAGGITICEVHVKKGASYGITIDPLNYDEIRAHVYDFAEHFIGNAPKDDELEESDKSVGISEEIKRAIRNMTGLNRLRKVGSDGKAIKIDGKAIWVDAAKELAISKNGERDYVVEALSLMNLPRRDRRDIWFDPTTGGSPLRWLQDTFLKINNGRHPDFTIPKRMEITVAHQLIPSDDLSVRLIDTKGIDQIAARPDIERFFGLTHTIMMLCSKFNDAPSDAPKLLLQRAVQSGDRTVTITSNILVLPHPHEALEVKDDSGARVESDEEGYELKKEQVESYLQSHKLNGLEVGFFNARGSDLPRAHAFVNQALQRVRRTYRGILAERVSDSAYLLSNFERVGVQEAIALATRELVRQMSDINVIGPIQGDIQESLWTQFSRAYAATVRATIRREGEWYNLNFAHHFRYGARAIVVKTLQPKVQQFNQHTNFMENDPHYLEAKTLITQARQILTDSFDDLLRKAELLGESVFKDGLAKDGDYWRRTEEQWGQGPGYKDRVRAISKQWFAVPEHRDYERTIKEFIDSEWTLILKKVTSILDVEAVEEQS